MREHSFAMNMGKCPLQVRRRIGLQMTLDGYDVLLGRLRMNGDHITDRLKEGGCAVSGVWSQVIPFNPTSHRLNELQLLRSTSTNYLYVEEGARLGSRVECGIHTTIMVFRFRLTTTGWLCYLLGPLRSESCNPETFPCEMDLVTRITRTIGCDSTYK